MVRRYVQGDLTEDAVAEWLAQNEERARLLDEQYSRVASRVPRGLMARVRITGRHVLESFSVHFTRRRGRVRTPPEQHAAVQVAREVSHAEEQLREAYQGAQRKFAEPKRKTGGFWSSPELVEQEMLAEGFSPDHVRAVIGAKGLRSLTGAAQRCVAERTNRQLDSVKAMASKGRKWLSQHAADNEPKG